jgi:casein kinase II subunit beta
MILDVEPEEDEEEDEDEEEEEENEESIEGESRIGTRRAADRRHNRMASDLSVIESSAELLYGLIHQRFICSRTGIQQMSEKYELSHFGNCPRTNCEHARTLPVGLSDIPGEDTVKLFCPSCLDVYVPPNSRFQTVDGAFFGRTFGALFLMTFPDYDISKKATEAVTTTAAPRTAPAAQATDGEEKPMINGMIAHNLGPGLGKGKVYEPRIYGFKVSERARSGPRMQWLRSRPDDINELDEAQAYAEEVRDDDSEDEGIVGGRGVRSARNIAPPRRRVPAANGGSPMSIEPNGEPFE